jgi:tetratricopeptide (TPR) repeat protein
VDIAGFSGLTRQLGTCGVDGVEQLTRLLRDTFQHILDVVEAQGGEPLQFLGDAVLAHFPSHDARDGAARAEEAARAIVSVPRQLAASKIGLRAGIGTGRLRLHLLPSSAEPQAEACALFLFAGSALESAGEAIRHAGPGQWRVHQEAGALEAVPTSTRSELPEPQRLVPRIVRQRLELGLAALEPEFRHVTVLFLRLNPTEDSHAVLRALSELQVTASARGGDMLQCASDDKGQYALLVFGLPGQGGEDYAERAFRCVLDLSKSPTFAAGWLAGISTGRCYVGLRGDQRLSDVGVVGPAVNRAAALMMAFSEGIHCDEASRSAAWRILFRHTGDVRLKGEEELIPSYSPLALDGRSRSTRGLLLEGRVAIERALIDFVTQAPKQQPSRILLLLGEAGGGKSSVLTTFAEHIECRESVVWLSGRQADSHMPLAPWTAWLLQRMPALSGLTDASVLMLRELAPYACLLNELLGTQLALTEPARLLSAEGRAGYLAAVLIRLILSLHSSVPLLVVDDLMLFDGPSLMLLDQVLGERSTVMVATSRNDTAPEKLAALRARFGGYELHELDLPPLDAHSSSALATTMFECTGVSRDLLDFLLERSRGNPLCLRELCLALRQRGLCTIDRGTATLLPEASLSNDVVPNTLHGLMAARVDHLDARLRDLVKLASILGDAFDVAVLARIAQEKIPGDLGTCVESLVKEGIFTLEENEGRFVHSLLRAAVYESIPRTQRLQTHAAVVEVLASAGSTSELSRAAQLAYHCERAEEYAAAAEHAARAGDLAQERFAHAEVIQFYQGALRNQHAYRATITQGSQAYTDRVRWLLGVGLAQVSQRDYAAAVEPLENALRMLGQPMPKSQLMTLAHVLVELARWSVGYCLKPRPRDHTPERARAIEQAADALEALGEVYYFGAAPERCFLSVVRQLRFAEDLGGGRWFTRACANAGITAGLLPVHALARTYLSRAEASLRASPSDTVTRGHVHVVRGLYFAGRGQWQQALDDFGVVLQLSRPGGHVRLELDAISNLAYIAYFNRHYDLAHALADRLLEVSRREPRYADEGRRIRMYCACQQDKLERAEEEASKIGQMLKARDTADALATRADLLAHTALIRAAQGRLPEALAAAGPAILFREENATGIGYYTDVVALDAVARALDRALLAASPHRGQALPLQKRAAKVLGKMASVYDFARPFALRAQLSVARAQMRHADVDAIATKLAQVESRAPTCTSADLERVLS